MIASYLDLARAHAALLAICLPFVGAAIVVALGQPRAAWIVAVVAALASACFAAELGARMLSAHALTLDPREGLSLEPSPLGELGVAAIALVTALVTASAGAFFSKRDRAGDVYALALVLSASGAWSGAALARDFTTMFLFVEMAWLSGVGLVALSASESKGALNGALRMLCTGGVASAVMLLGIVLIERGFGDSVIANLATARIAAPTMATLGAALILVSLAWKAGFAPLNAWMAAVYGRGGGFSALAISSIAAAGAAMVITNFAAAALSAPTLANAVSVALSVLGVASAAIGSVQAIGASSLRRMVAYGAAAQMGCAILGVALGSPAGLEAAIIQIISLSVAAIALLGAASLGGVGVSMQSVDGLGRRAPLAAIVMTLGALSLMGAPLTLSFLGRWRLVEAALGIGSWWAAAPAILTSLAGSYYGGRLIERIYFRRATQTHAPSLDVGAMKWALAPALAVAAFVIVSAIEPSLLLRAVGNASQLIQDRGQ